jgi:hypothetical protein
MICPKCGTEYGKSVSICSYCNETLISVAHTTTSNSVPPQIPTSAQVSSGANGDMVCPTCGKTNPAAAMCCDNCGSDFFKQPHSKIEPQMGEKPTQTSGANQSEKICPTCVQSNPLTAVACSFCGHELKASVVPISHEDDLILV